MSRWTLDEATLRALVAQQPFYAIAARFNIDTRAVAALAARYGLTSAFVAKAATAPEEARIAELQDAGWSIKRIAEAMGRSQDFVARRVHGLAKPVGAAVRGRPSRGAWPRPDTNIETALRKRSYDDVDETVLARECPPGRWAINGAALAAAGRFAAGSFTRSAADLCADE